MLTDTDTDTDTKQLKSKLLSADAEREFAACWDAYPKRPGNSRAAALKAYRARRKEGVAPEPLLAGVRAYAAYCEREGTEPRFIKQASTFFGPGRHWETDYGPVTPEAIWPYVDEQGVPGPDGDRPNPAFMRMLAETR